MNLIVNAYRRGYVNAVLSDPQNVRMVLLWLESHPGQISYSPMLKDLKNRVDHLNTPIVASDIESKILSGRFHELTPEDLVKNLELIRTHLELKTLPEESIQRLSKSQILRLSAISNIRLPPFAENFRRQILQTKRLDKIKGLTDLTEEEKDAALAYYIEHHKIPLKDIEPTVILRLAPHLRYVDLKGFLNIPLAKELLQKCSNPYGLLINNDAILENVSSLPLCQELNCMGCTNLLMLPALPLCEMLYCWNCTNLQALPALPLCERLYCGRCINLQALPELPFCKELYCCECPKLTALPALPVCKELDCSRSANLLTLQALPLCKKLNCWRCTNLQALPELPLCEWLVCGGCTNLTTMPLSLGQNPGLTAIDISDTRIDPAVRDAILNQSRRMRAAEAVKILPFRLAKWKAIAKSDADLDVSALSDDQKKTLNEWLLRLERTKDFSRSQSLLANTVCNILEGLLKNAEFQELFFLQAEANNSCCGDRAAMSLNEIYTSWRAMCKSGDLQMLTGIAKTLCLRKELQKLIGNQMESVEIFLYYESTLRERLGLETAIQNMTFGNIGNRNWINEDKLVEDVEAHFFEELYELPVFQKRIVFDNSEFLTKLGECPTGDPNDPQVLNFQHRQGEIMQEWKREKMRAAKQWYKENI